MEIFVFVYLDKLIDGKIEGGFKIYLGGDVGVENYYDVIDELIFLNKDLDREGLFR